MTLGASGLDCRMTTVSVCHVVCSQARAFRAAIDVRMATAAMAANEVLARVADVASCDLLDLIDVDEKGGVKVDLKLANRRGLGHLIKRLRINKDGIQDSFHRDVANRGGGDRFRP